MTAGTRSSYLVTGGVGFIGSHLCKALLEGSDQRIVCNELVILDDFNDFYDPRIKEAHLKVLSETARSTGTPLHLYRVDIRDRAALEPIFERHAPGLRQGGIVHLAARAGVRPSLLEPALYLSTNVDGTFNLVDLARRHDIQKFVFASSSSVYGDNPDQVPFREDQDVNHPISPYAATKIMGENLLYSYVHLYQMQIVALRFFTVYGPSQRPDLAIHKFTRLISEGKTIPVFGDGSTRRDYTYIDDIIQGVLAAVHYDKTPFEVVNLGESQTTSLSELIAHLEEALGKKAIIDRLPLQPGDVPITYACIDKARNLLNYRPVVPVSQGIPRFVAWYKTHQNALSATL